MEAKRKETVEYIRQEFELCKKTMRSFDQSDPAAQMTLIRAGTHVKNIERLLNDSKIATEEALYQELLREGTHLILDVTFVSESRLVEEDFPKEKISVMDHILEDLQKPRLFAKAFRTEGLSASQFDQDEDHLLNALGALNFMYVSTLVTSGRTSELKVKSIDTAVRELENMIRIRIKDYNLKGSRNKQKPAKENDVEALISNGVWSDSHLLSIIYGGEAAYWRYKYFPNLPEAQEYKEKSIQLLKKFKQIVDNHLTDAGWNSDRAVEILKELEK